MSAIFGVATKGLKAQDYAYFALYALQHRGQVGSGMAANKNGYIDYHKSMGVVSQSFSRKELKKLESNIVLAQIDNSQTHVDEETLGPVLMGNRIGSFAIAFDGSLLNKEELCKKYRYPEDITDGRLVGSLIAAQYMEDLVAAVRKVVPELVGAYAFALLTHDVLIGCRDPYGVKMLSVGKMKDSYMIATETCAFESLGAEVVCEVEPGQMVILSKNQLVALEATKTKDCKICMFELIYTSRPDSEINGTSVYTMRKEIGKKLALLEPEGFRTDMVISSPDSGTVAAMGYAEQSGFPFHLGIIKNRYIGRTFIIPDKELRNMAVQIKLNVIKDTVKGKSLVIVDDSIVRGTTMARVVTMLKEAGAREVHVRIASPLVQYPCRIQVNLSIQKDLLADELDVEGIRKMLGADTLSFLPVQGLLESIPNSQGFCIGCLNNHYPILEEENGAKL